MATAEALPVLLGLAGPAASRIRRHLEGELGWQPVEGDGLVRPLVRIVDVAGAEGAAPGGPPTWVVVTEQDDAVDAAQAAGAVRAVAVVPWPPAPGAFAAAAAGLAPDAPSGPGEELRVGGASGGVGCTTAALALAGIAAWSGRRSLLVTHGAVPHPVPATLDAEALRSPDLARVAHPVRGVAGLTLVHVESPAADVVVRTDGHEIVRDLGVDTAADVLVARRDPAGLAAVPVTTAGTILLSDAGPIPVAAFRRAAAGRRLVILPWSARVARAAVLGRVPASLPGSWLRCLAEVAGRHPQRPGDARSRPGSPSLR